MHFPEGYGRFPRPFVAGSSIAVETMIFDSLISEPAADPIKIDVEDAELLVLEGMRESLASRRVCNILVELHDRDRKAELEAILNSNFSHVFWVDPPAFVWTQGCCTSAQVEAKAHKADPFASEDGLNSQLNLLV